ncbi:MAG: pantoate--beta-alanine ligase, partial [Desulfovibrio sp.]|nr:pantoate--beta-alanine ligase [Desulfovibrio sp.]
MQIVKTAKELSELCRSWHKDGQTVALVPTMGYYH